MGTYSCPDSSRIAAITWSAISRRALPGGSSASSGAIASGLPIVTPIRPGRGTICPGPSTCLVPDSATGMTGRPDFSASQPTPGRPRYKRPSGDLVPSG
jgi:hypothetical protein